jgi:hypothetical protein
MRLKVSDVLPRLLPCYRSIDLRCAIGFYIDEWVNIHTVIRFTHLRTSQIKALYDNLAKALPVIDTRRFKIICKALPLSRWDFIKKQISSGCLDLNGLRFKVQSTDIDALPCLIARNPLHVMSEGWNVAEAASDYVTIPFERYEADLLKLGYPTTYTALNSWLHTKITSPMASAIVIAAPVYAKILSSERKTERTLRVVVRRSEFLGDLNLIVEVIRERDEQEKMKETLQLHNILLKSKKKDRPETLDLRLPASLQADQIKVSLLSNQPTPITLDWYEVTLSEKKTTLATRPLFTLFNKLRDISYIQDCLHKEGVIRVDNFYNAVIWMLSLCGLSTIYLGDVVRESKGVIRHIEIIGSDQATNSIILGMRARSEFQIAKCISVLEKIRDSVAEEVSIETQVIPLLFYKDIAPEASKKISATKGIFLLDVLELNKIAELLTNGNIKEARRKLGLH